jgi:hypothetical protein
MLLIEFVDFFKEVLIMQSNNYQNCSKLIMYNNDPYLFGVLVNLLKMNTNGFSHNTMSLQQWLKSGSVRVKAPVTPELPDPSKRYIFAKLQTRSQNLNYNNGSFHPNATRL